MERIIRDSLRQCINVYSTDKTEYDMQYDVFIVLHEIEETVTCEQIDKVTNIVEKNYEDHGGYIDAIDLRDNKELEEMFGDLGFEVLVKKGGNVL